MTRDRLAKTVLAILGIWGLAAGLMLIHTLLATKQLHKRVSAITTSVSDIDRDTASVALMQETNRLSAALLAASQPLPATLDAMRGVTGGLAAKVDSILAGSTTIESNSKKIEGKVVSARDTAAAIGGSVGSIGKSVASILATLRATQAAAGEINASTKGINSAVAALLPVVRSIDDGIGRANRGIAEAAGYVDAIRADIGNILAGLPDVEKHARSIDCGTGLMILSGGAPPGPTCSP
jgi:ABC-type transporter Mla subunit MlaD